jgi:hypothetical protein
MRRFIKKPEVQARGMITHLARASGFDSHRPHALQCGTYFSLAAVCAEMTA